MRIEIVLPYPRFFSDVHLGYLPQVPRYQVPFFPPNKHRIVNQYRGGGQCADGSAGTTCRYRGGVPLRVNLNPGSENLQNQHDFGNYDRVLLLGTRQGQSLSSCKSMGRHCVDNNAGAQRYPFSGRFQISFFFLHSASPGC
jgi:hypothetical protein